jgi:hypothetical protein
MNYETLSLKAKKIMDVIKLTATSLKVLNAGS